ncbi:hypothetical protein H6G76_20090 [Nostoc sp. FACHB-152]|uniref:hypothetical protein n=1 Tax=Nostoc sp. FACHB-152 TaxID=2692837 RepID=UPI0016822E54|nr:hypothetical protein [Nostoc sp. FACHB-152]MBD2449419.1 hypothetical protein [Nostoc sp. FACHB-152]
MVGTNITVGNTTDTVFLQLSITPTNIDSNLILEANLNGVSGGGTATLSLGWNSNPVVVFGRLGGLGSSFTSSSFKIILPANHNGLGMTTRNYQLFGKVAVGGTSVTFNTGGLGISSLTITEVSI